MSIKSLKSSQASLNKRPIKRRERHKFKITDVAVSIDWGGLQLEMSSVNFYF